MIRRRRRLKRKDAGGDKPNSSKPKSLTPKGKSGKKKVPRPAHVRKKPMDIPVAQFVVADIPEEVEPKSMKGLIVTVVIVIVVAAAVAIFVYPPWHFNRTLSALSRGSETDRKWAAMELSDFGEKAVPELVKLMETGDDMTGRYAAMSLARIGGLKESMKLIKSVRPQTRINAIRVLARAQNGAARQAVVHALEDDAPDVRRVACEWIGLNKIQEAFDPLIKTIADPVRKVREKAAIALGQISDPRKIRVLVDLCASSDDPKVRSALLEILTSRAFLASAVDILLYIESKCDKANRSAGLTYARLGEEIGGQGGENIVTILLRHDDPDVRAAAVRGAVGLDMRHTAKTMVNMVLSDFRAPCEAAMRGLVFFRSRGFDDMLVVALDSPDEFRRFCGLKILTATSKKELVKPALELLADDSNRVVMAAHAALMAAADRMYGIQPKITADEAGWKKWFGEIEKEMGELKAIDDKMAIIRQLLSDRTEYKRAETMCKEVETTLNGLKTELIATPRSYIERKLTRLNTMRYQAFKMQTLKQPSGDAQPRKLITTGRD